MSSLDTIAEAYFHADQMWSIANSMGSAVSSRAAGPDFDPNYWLPEGMRSDAAKGDTSAASSAELIRSGEESRWSPGRVRMDKLNLNSSGYVDSGTFEIPSDEWRPPSALGGGSACGGSCRGSCGQGKGKGKCGCSKSVSGPGGPGATTNPTGGGRCPTLRGGAGPIDEKCKVSFSMKPPVVTGTTCGCKPNHVKDIKCPFIMGNCYNCATSIVTKFEDLWPISTTCRGNTCEGDAWVRFSCQKTCHYCPFTSGTKPPVSVTGHSSTGGPAWAVDDVGDWVWCDCLRKLKTNAEANCIMKYWGDENRVSTVIRSEIDACEEQLKRGESTWCTRQCPTADPQKPWCDQLVFERGKIIRITSVNPEPHNANCENGLCVATFVVKAVCDMTCCWQRSY